MKRISIILIIKDDYQLFKLVLKSYRNLNYPKDSFEVIIVDDGSEKPVLDFINFKLPNNFHSIYLPRTSISCRSKARNTGAEKARFEYLLFIDGDHIVEPDLLVKYNQYFNIRRNRKVVLGTRRQVLSVDRNAMSVGFDLTNEFLPEFKNNYVLDSRLHLLNNLNKPFNSLIGRWHLFYSCNFCILADVYHQVGGFDENFIEWGLEDTEFGYRLFNQGYDFELLDNYVWHLYPLERSHGGIKYAGWLKNMDYFFNKYRDLKILSQLEFDSWFFYFEQLSESDHQENLNWVQCYINFENKLNYITQNELMFSL